MQLGLPDAALDALRLQVGFALTRAAAHEAAEAKFILAELEARVADAPEIDLGGAVAKLAKLEADVKHRAPARFGKAGLRDAYVVPKHPRRGASSSPSPHAAEVRDLQLQLATALVDADALAEALARVRSLERDLATSPAPGALRAKQAEVDALAAALAARPRRSLAGLGLAALVGAGSLLVGLLGTVDVADLACHVCTGGWDGDVGGEVERLAH